MKTIKRLFLIFLALTVFSPLYARPQSEQKTGREIRKVLFIGDSMTGWLSERLAAYGRENGFDVATVIWDGSTISKWSNANISKYINSEKPDAVFLSLGMNELFESNPEARLHTPVGRLMKLIGDTPFLWIGPPSWPQHDKGSVLDQWLANRLGKENYFSSFNLKLPRQSKSNPHPTKEGMMQWMDAIIKWIPSNSNLNFNSLTLPSGQQMVRGKTFIYKRMKENP